MVVPYDESSLQHRFRGWKTRGTLRHVETVFLPPIMRTSREQNARKRVIVYGVTNYFGKFRNATWKFIAEEVVRAADFEGLIQ